MVCYMHSVPGRLRVKIPQLRNNIPHCQEVQALLLGLVGVQDVEANCLTGSILIRYDLEFITAEDLVRALEEENHFQAHQAVGATQYIEKAAVRAGETVGKVMLSWALGQALGNSPLGLLAAFI